MSKFRIFEIILYSCLNLLPYIGLAIYPFTEKLRFSKQKTISFIIILAAFQSIMGVYATTCSQGQKGLISLISTACYAAFYFVAVKEKFGKLVFVLLIVSNFANFVVMAAKWLEGQIFPQMALQNNRWTFSVCTFVIQLIFVPLMFIFFKKFIKEVAYIETNANLWRYLWMIPATFYLFWYHGLYFNSKSSLELALNYVNLIFTFFINVGALLVYGVLVNALIEFEHNLKLRDENKQLALQNLRYDELKKQMDVTRRARHDLRQHISVVYAMAQKNECEKIEEYLGTYLNHSYLKNPIVYCGNFALNAVLVYYVQQAEKADIKINIDIALPNEISIKDADLTVLFGNLIENAIDACENVQKDKRSIELKIHRPNAGSIVFSIDNTFDGNIKMSGNIFLSTKQNGSGIGIESAKYVVEKYNGDMKIEINDNKFCVSGVLLQ